VRIRYDRDELWNDINIGLFFFTDSFHTRQLGIHFLTLSLWIEGRPRR